MEMSNVILLSVLATCGGFILGILVGIDSERHKRDQNP